MPQQLTYPGVYVEEVPSGVRTIIGVATSITAFVGRTPRGPVDEPTLVNNYSEFVEAYGGLWDGSRLGFAVRDFYLNGGRQALIVRVYKAPDGDDFPGYSRVKVAPAVTLRASSPGTWGNSLRVSVDHQGLPDADPRGRFNLTIVEGERSERILGVSLYADDARPIDRALERESALVRLADGLLPATTGARTSPEDQPVAKKVDDPPSEADKAAEEAGKKAEAAKQKNRAVVDADDALAAATNAKAAADREKTAADAEAEKTGSALKTATEEATKAAKALTDAEGMAPGPERDAAVEKATDDKAAADLTVTIATEADTAAKDRAKAADDRASETSDDLDKAGEAQTKASAEQKTAASELATAQAAAAAAAAHEGPAPGKGGGDGGLPADLWGSAEPILAKADVFNLLCIPPYKALGEDVEPSVYDAAGAYCAERRAVLLVDPPSAWTRPASVPALFSSDPDPVGGRASGANAALFFPRLKQPNPLREGTVEEFVPCGAVAGVFARTDATRGVWKAPAGIEAGITGVDELTVNLTDDQNGRLNPLGINCLRTFPVIGDVVWGARTLKGADRLASEWKYIPIRRLALYIEESLFRGTQWVVFEPNDEPLWAQIRLSVGSFMRDLFRQGAFQGPKPRDAYFVKCDGETTTQSDRNKGIVNINVGFAPLKPAEFVVIRLQQIAGQIEV